MQAILAAKLARGSSTMRRARRVGRDWLGIDREQESDGNLSSLQQPDAD
jgi:hypothetical protein